MRFLLWFALCCSILSGCTAALPPEDIWRPRQDGLVWPKPPSPPRIKYLRTLIGPQDFVRPDQAAGFLDWLVGARALNVPLLTPMAVAADGASRVWVADSSAGMVFQFDLAKEQIDYFRQVGDLEMQSPSGLAYDPRSERLYVADGMLGKVFVLGEKGALLGERLPPEGFGRPGGLAVDKAGRLYVADALRGEIIIFDADGRVQGRVGSRSSADGRFQRPTQIAFGPQGELLVVDALRFLIEVQGPTGQLLGTIGEVGDGPGTFARPRGIAVDSEGHVYVADAAFDNVQIFNLTGQLLLHWGGAGSAHGQFNLPAGLFMDGANRLYVADSYNHRVEVFAYLGPATAEVNSR
jgi:DNA-binding beta-propeller fold protein YncE